LADADLRVTVKSNFDFAKSSMDTYRGKARYYNLGKMSEVGCDIGQLPYSIRVLLENLVRSANNVPGASDAAYKL